MVNLIAVYVYSQQLIIAKVVIIKHRDCLSAFCNFCLLSDIIIHLCYNLYGNKFEGFWKQQAVNIYKKFGYESHRREYNGALNEKL